MAKYMLLLGGADLDKRSGNKELVPRMFAAYQEWLAGVRERGQYVASHKLQDQTGARLTVRGGQVVEGPFMETKEAVGGYLIIEVPSLEEAVAVARKCPVFAMQNGSIEVRLVEEAVRPGG